MTENFEPASAETLYIAAHIGFGQGDVLKFSSCSGSSYLGVIINADCDLANQKTDGVISYLPIYSLRKHLTHFWMREFVENQRSQLVSKILLTCQAKDEDPGQFIDWMRSEDNNVMVENLSSELGFDRKEKTRLTDLVETYRRVFRPRKGPQEEFSLLCRMQADGLNYAKKQIKGAYKQMGDGHLVLNQIRGIDELGFVVRTRRIYSIDVNNCYRSEPEERIGNTGKGNAAIRISKLSPVFQFKLAQLFAYQFSRVGLPDEFGQFRQLVLEELAEQMIRETK